MGNWIANTSPHLPDVIANGNYQTHGAPLENWGASYGKMPEGVHARDVPRGRLAGRPLSGQPNIQPFHAATLSAHGPTGDSTTIPMWQQYRQMEDAFRRAFLAGKQRPPA